MDKLLNHKFDSDEEDEDYVPDAGNTFSLNYEMIGV